MSTSSTPFSASRSKMHTYRRALIACILMCMCAVALSACGNSQSKPSGDAQSSTQAQSSTAGHVHPEVTLITHNDFKLPEELKTKFEQEAHLKLNIIQSSSGAEMVNKLKLAKNAPFGDVVYGLSTNDMGLIRESGILTDSGISLSQDVQAFVDPALPVAVPIDHGDVCLNYDKEYFEKAGIPAPQTLEDLTKPEYKNMLVTINPQKVTGFAFLAATIAHFGEDGWEQYWKDLKANGMKVVGGWSEAYEQEFTAGGGDGKYPIVVSYASSPSFTVSKDGKTSRTAALLPSSFGQVEYAGVLTNAANPEGAKKVIEWLLSAEVQEAIPSNMYVYPVRAGVKLPESFKFAPAAEKSLSLPAERILEQRENWLRTWTGLFA